MGPQQEAFGGVARSLVFVSESRINNPLNGLTGLGAFVEGILRDPLSGFEGRAVLAAIGVRRHRNTKRGMQKATGNFQSCK